MKTSSHENLFAKLLKNQFNSLPSVIQTLHTATLPRRFVGRVKIVAANNPITRTLAWIAGLPTRTCEVDFHIDIEPDIKRVEQQGQIWTRAFPPRPFRSTLRADEGFLLEQVGPAQLLFELMADGDSIVWTLRQVRVLGLSLPLIIFGDVRAREFVQDGRYHFEVYSRLPLLGHLVSYHGNLDV